MDELISIYTGVIKLGEFELPCYVLNNKIIASLRQQLKDAVSRCNALEQENALLTYQLEKVVDRTCK